MKHFRLLAGALTATVLFGCQHKPIDIREMSVELLDNPISVATPSPRFGWQIASEASDVMQTGFRIIVASTEKDLDKEQNLIWDSGDSTTDQSQFIAYAGPKLQPRAEYFWKVRIATNKGDTVWSTPSHWTMTITDQDWKATWIGLDSAINASDRTVGNTRLAARYLRKPIEVKGGVASARLYISGLGLYECYINGKKVSDDVLAPTATDYNKSVNFNTYDVTSMLKGKQNTLGVILGSGRYMSMRGLQEGSSHRQFGYPKLLAQLEITYKDGSRETIVSDTSWKLTTNGPIVTNNEYDGEEYDANLEMKGWNENGFNDAKWQNAMAVAAPTGKLTAQTNPNITIMERIAPVKIFRQSDSTLVLDMGQNMVGWLNITLDGKKGKPIKMRFAETLRDDSSIYMANLRGALVTDIYTPSADGRFTWEPRFTYHGFRYVELSGLDYIPTLDAFKGCVIYDKMKTIGQFECSDSTINQIFKNAYWGIRGNYRSMPTDCPQRDERMGWLGDRATGCFGESYIFNNSLLYEKWLRDIEEAQAEDGCVPDVAPRHWSADFLSGNVTWPAAYICAANMLYLQRGDTRPIVEHYASMKRWIDYIATKHMTDYIVTGDVYGDWCMPPESPELIWSADPARKTDGNLLGTSFYYRLLNIMSNFAQVSGNSADVATYQDMAMKVREAYNKQFLNAEKGEYSNNTVTANMASLMQGLVPDSLRAKVFENVVNKTRSEFNSHVSTGLIGIQFLMRGLTRNGAGDLAYTIATNRDYPSWGYMASKGATTIWELWNGDTANPEMNSGNHVMLLGDFVSWLFEDVAGIRNDSEQVGFKKIVMEPYFPKGLTWAKASVETLYGEVSSSWKRDDNKLSWEVEIPANTTATVRIPSSQPNDVTVDDEALLKNPAVKSAKVSDKFVTVEIGSGKFEFKAAQ